MNLAALILTAYVLLPTIALTAENNVRCPYIVSIPHGSVKYGTKRNKPGGFIKFSCEDGYKRHGLRDLKCQSSGTWRGEIPTCKFNRCPNIIGQQHGKIRAYKDTPGGLAIFQCDRGYTLLGKGTISCGNDLNWGANPPKCIPTSCPPIITFNNGIVLGYTKKTTTSQLIRYKCDDGYVIRRPDLKWSRCRKTLEWGPPVPTCKCKDPDSDQCINDKSSKCPFIVGIPHGTHKVISGDGLTEGSQVKFACDKDWNLDGSDTVTCRSGSWGDLPTCSVGLCHHIENVPNGEVDKPDLYRQGDTLKITCKPGYKPEGSHKITCGIDRSWSDAPNCVDTRCRAIDVFPNGRVKNYKTLPGSKISFECDAGYTLVGETHNECISGTWKYDIPKCTSKT